MSTLEEIRKYRIPVVNLAIFDTVGTAVGAYYLSQYMEWDLSTTLLYTFAAAEVIHIAAGVETPITRGLIDNPGASSS